MLNLPCRSVNWDVGAASRRVQVYSVSEHNHINVSLQIYSVHVQHQMLAAANARKFLALERYGRLMNVQ